MTLILKTRGPAKLRALFEEHGGLPAGVHINPSKSGGEHFVFRDPEGRFSNRAGLLKKNYGTDVRGTGGQFVSPGAIREDGATYGDNEDKLAFMRAIVGGKIPHLPDYVVDLIGSQDQSEAVEPSKEREIIKLLEETDWDEYRDDFDPTLGVYDIERLKSHNTKFAKLYDSPGSDCSNNRFLAARHVMRGKNRTRFERGRICCPPRTLSPVRSHGKPTPDEKDLVKIAKFADSDDCH